MSCRGILGLVIAAVAGVCLAASAATAAGPPAVAARAYLVENAATGEVLAARHPRESVPIASITKLMTVLVTLEHRRLADVVAGGPPPAGVREAAVNPHRGARLAGADPGRG